MTWVDEGCMHINRLACQQFSGLELVEESGEGGGAFCIDYGVDMSGLQRSRLLRHGWVCMSAGLV